MNIRPFAAIRPSPADASRVASVAYDVVSTDEAREIARQNPKSFIRVSRPEVDLPPGSSFSSEEAYAQAKRTFGEFLADGTLVRDGERSLYVYRQRMGEHEQTGVVATFDTKEYLSGVVKKHETTRRDKEDDRARHIEVLGAQTGPAFLAYRDDKAIDELVRDVTRDAPLYDFTASDGVRHTVWTAGSASSCLADELVELFARIPTAYIADGHHRSAAASRYAQSHGFEGESRWFLAVAFPASQLKILPYNRLVADLNGLSEEAFLTRVSDVFRLDGAGERSARMYFRGRWHSLSWDVPPATRLKDSLDVAFLQERFLKPVLGIDDPRTNARISFVGGVRGEEALSRAVDAGRAAVAFSMKPVSIDVLMALADQGETMPPKSTWFEPKLLSGLFVHEV